MFAPLLSHTTATPRQAGTSLISQATPAAGRRFESQPNRDLSTLRNPAHNQPGQVSGVYLQVGGYRCHVLPFLLVCRIVSRFPW